MWLSEKAAGAGGRSGVSAQVGTVTIGGARASVLVGGEERSLELVTPGGVQWRPKGEQEVLVLETESGERFILGAVGAEQSLGDGEVCLRCGSTWLRLANDGSISAEGEVHLAGDVYITGRLFLNGVELTAGGLGV